MRKPHLLLVLCALAFALAVALVKPLPSRADNGAGTQPTPPDPTPTTGDAIEAPSKGSDATSAYTRRSRPATVGRVGISAQSSCNTCPGR